MSYALDDELATRSSGLLAMDDPDMGACTYAYDPVGNLVAQQDARGQGLYLEYDAANRLVSKRADAANGPLVAEYEYDLTYLGQQDLTRAYESTGITVTVETEVLARDERYRPTEQGWTVLGDGAYRMAYGYDAADHITTLQYPADDAGYSVSGTLGEVVAQSYDLLGRLDGVESTTYGTSYVSGTAYAPTGLVLEQTLGSGAGAVARSYSYEAGSLRLLGLTSAVTTTIQSLAYTYDEVGNVLSITDGVNAGQVQTFGYDDLDRLTAAATDAAGVGQYDHDYGYDAIGNITALDGITYTYGIGQPHAVTGVGNDSYQYDDNGNMTVRVVGGITYTLTYDRENRLTGVTGPSTSATFVYDAAGNRVLATVDGQMKAYVGGVYEHTGTGASTSSYAGSVIRRSGYANENGVFTVLGDHLGSTSVLVDATGAVAAQQYYYPYGANRGGAQSDLTERRYTGQYHEAELAGAEGLYYYNARWYDPASGRFVQADTIVPSPGNPQSRNRYAYVLGNPLKYVDPRGHIAGHYREIIAAAEIVIDLERFGVTVNHDWGPSRNIYNADVGAWDEGSWALADLYETRDGVHALGDKLGGKDAFQQRVGPVHIERVKGSRDVVQDGERKTVLGWTLPAGLQGPVRVIQLFNDCFAKGRTGAWTVVHELAHVWDSRPGEMGSEWIDAVALRELARPSKYATTNDKEHWAEVVKFWCYPDALSSGGLASLYLQYMDIAVSGW